MLNTALSARSPGTSYNVYVHKMCAHGSAGVFGTSVAEATRNCDKNENCGGVTDCGGFQYAARWRGGTTPQYFSKSAAVFASCEDNLDWTSYVKSGACVPWLA